MATRPNEDEKAALSDQRGRVVGTAQSGQLVTCKDQIEVLSVYLVRARTELGISGLREVDWAGDFVQRLIVERYSHIKLLELF